MTKKDRAKQNHARDDLVKAFSKLTDQQKARLMFHIEKGTHILCGNQASLYGMRGAG